MTDSRYFFSHPMRPFFVTAALLAIAGGAVFFVSGNFVVLHRQIFLTFMPAAAYGGFLMAAMPEWTGYKGRLNVISRLSGSLLAGGLVCLPFHAQAAAFFVAAYWLGLLLFCAWLLWLDRNTDNFALLLLLVWFTVFQTAYAHTQDVDFLRALVHIHIAAVVFVSFRVSILLGNQALKECRLKDPVFIPSAVYKNMAVTFLLMYTAAERWLPPTAAGFAALSVGLILLAKLRELHHLELLRKHYVRTYYWMQLFCASGYLWLGLAKLAGRPVSAPLHLIAIGGMLGAVMMVYLTAGLWHSGFAKLDYPGLCRIAFVCLFAAALSRSLLMNIHPLFYIAVPAGLVAAAFVLYLVTFVPIFRQNPFTDDPE